MELEIPAGQDLTILACGGGGAASSKAGGGSGSISACRFQPTATAFLSIKVGFVSAEFIVEIG